MVKGTTGSTDRSAEIVKLMTEMVRFVRFLAVREAHEVSKKVLDTEAKRRVYGLSDGTKTIRQLAEVTKVNKDTISGWWREWHAQGLVESVPGTHGTRRAVFSLDDLGI